MLLNRQNPNHPEVNVNCQNVVYIHPTCGLEETVIAANLQLRKQLAPPLRSSYIITFNYIFTHNIETVLQLTRRSGCPTHLSVVLEVLEGSFQLLDNRRLCKKE